MSLLRVSRLTLEYVRTTVTASADPTGDVVEFAFVTTDRPGDTDWETGGWDPDVTTYDARILVGPGGTVELDAGTYGCWIRVTDNPERPAIYFGTMIVT